MTRNFATPFLSLCCTCLFAGAFAAMPAAPARADAPMRADAPARADAHERWAEAHLALDDLKEARNKMDKGDLKAARKNLESARDHLKLEEVNTHRDLTMKHIDAALDAADHDHPRIAADNTDKAIEEIQLAWK